MNENQPPSRSELIERKVDKNITAELTMGAGGNLDFANLNQIMEVARVVAVASVAIPKHLRDNVGACLAVCVQASEWQLSPFAVANKSYVVNDRLAYEAQLINSVILKRAPIIGRFKIDYRGEARTRRCKVSVKLKDGDTVEYESPEIGTITVQNSPLWKSDPDQQLFFYSSRAMCRRHFPDVLLGIYTPEEMAEETMREVTPGKPQIDEPAAPSGTTVSVAPPAAPKPEPKPKAEKKKPEPQAHAEAAQQPAKEQKPAPEQIGKKEAPEASDPQPDSTPANGASATPPPAEASLSPEDERERQSLVEQINELADSREVSTKKIRAWAFEGGIVSDERMILAKYPIAALQQILKNFDANWPAQ